MLYSKFGSNLSVCSAAEDFKISPMYFCYKCFVIFSLRKRRGPSFKLTWITVWLQFAHRFWRRRLLHIVVVYSLFFCYLLLERGVALPLNKFKSFSPNDHGQQAMRKAYMSYQLSCVSDNTPSYLRSIHTMDVKYHLHKKIMEYVSPHCVQSLWTQKSSK